MNEKEYFQDSFYDVIKSGDEEDLQKLYSQNPKWFIEIMLKVIRQLEVAKQW